MSALTITPQQSFPVAAEKDDFVGNAALFSKNIYASTDQTPPAAAISFSYHQEPNLVLNRTADWAIYVSDKLSVMYVVFRGTANLLDWVVNLSVLAISIPTIYGDGIMLHSGYTAEINREYDEIFDLLQKHLKPGMTIVVTGHSKGGGLSQIFTHRLYKDGDFWDSHPENKLVCITFAAPMIFWSVERQVIPSTKLMHNHLIMGDPVPVAQLLLLYNPDGFLEMLGKLLGGVLDHIPNVRNTIADNAILGTNYRLVGRFYGVELPDLEDLNGKSFEELTEIPYDLSTWDYVLTDEVSAERHHMQYYYDCIHHTAIMVNKSDTGFYFMNETSTDVTIGFSMLGFNKTVTAPPNTLVFQEARGVWNINVAASSALANPISLRMTWARGRATVIQGTPASISLQLLDLQATQALLAQENEIVSYA